MTNLVMIIADQWRHTAIGALGQDAVLTPNLDRLAAHSRMLTRAVSNFPLCSPARAMMLTGRHSFQNGVPSNCNSQTARMGVGLREDLSTWSDVLSEAGYQCGYIGKWHLDPPTDEDAIYGEGPRTKWGSLVWDAYTPIGRRRHGFDFWHSYGCCDRHFTPHYWTGDAPREKPTQVQQWSPIHETDVATDFLRSRDPNRPFALVVSYNPPHMPFKQVPDRYRDLYDGADPRELLNRPNVRLEGKLGEEALWSVQNYFAMITGVDEQIGRLLATLDELSLTDDTLVVVTSDHGEMMGSHNLMGKNVAYDESLLIPTLIRWPGRITPGRDDLLFGMVDMAPTLLSLLGLGDRHPADMTGRDLAAALVGQDGPRPDAALYLSTSVEGGHDRRGLRTDRWTFVVEREADRDVYTLFDCQEDPYQLTNVAADRPDVVDDLTGLLRDELIRTADSWRYSIPRPTRI